MARVEDLSSLSGLGSSYAFSLLRSADAPSVGIDNVRRSGSVHAETSRPPLLNSMPIAKLVSPSLFLSSLTHLFVPELVIIAAVAEENRVIGKDRDLPWHIPEDLQHFKELTTGHPLLMGRRTFESVVHQFGGPLPDRRMMVLTHEGPFEEYPEIETYPSIDAAMDAVADEDVVFIGGGEAVYRQFLPKADRLELTLVEGSYEGDTYFPPFEHLVGDVFEQTSVDQRDGFRFVTYRRGNGEGA